MTECVRCLYDTNHPFGLVIDDEGVCSGCRVHQEKSDLDWSGRLDDLAERLAPATRRSRWYDCVVPVRGTPEYFIVLDVVVNRLGLRPLVVAYNTQFNSQVGIRNVDLMRETFDVDILIYASNPVIYRKLVRESMVRTGSIRWPLLAGTTQFPVQTAVEKQIPTVIWPLHQPTEQVGTHSYLELNTMSRRDRHEFDLMGVEPHELVTTDTLLRLNDIEDLRYPSDRMLAKVGVVGHYLANYLPWDTRRYSEEAIERFGAIPATNPRTFDPYERVDDMSYMTAHDLMKQAKLGYGRVVDTLVQEIRFGRVDRSTAVEIADHYQRMFPCAELRVFLEWIGMSEDAFRWSLRRLPFGEPEPGDPDAGLSPMAQRFVDGYHTGTEKVHDAGFTVFGKGLGLEGLTLGEEP